MIILHAIECECQECLDKWEKLEKQWEKPVEKAENKITKVNPLPKEVEAWALCRLLHTKRPVQTGKKIFIESIQEWREEIIWVCDHCDIKTSEHNDIKT